MSYSFHFISYFVLSARPGLDYFFGLSKTCLGSLSLNRRRRLVCDIKEEEEAAAAAISAKVNGVCKVRPK